MLLLKYLFIFLVFSVVGWIIEFLYRSLMTKEIVNPGFMTGCVVPLYGFGAIILNILCKFFSNVSFSISTISIFILSIILLSSLEYITMYILFKFFNMKLWDYSNRKLNINGFVCLRFSLVWGILALIYYYFIFPWINDFTLKFLNNRFCLFSLGILFGTFIVDLFISIDLLKKLKEYSKNIQQIIDLEKIKIDSITNSTRKKFWKAIYPYISTNKFLKDKIKKK